MFKVVTFSSCPLKRLLEVFGASGVEMLLEKFPERFPHWVRQETIVNTHHLHDPEVLEAVSEARMFVIPVIPSDTTTSYICNVRMMIPLILNDEKDGAPESSILALESQDAYSTWHPSAKCILKIMTGDDEGLEILKSLFPDLILSIEDSEE